MWHGWVAQLVEHGIENAGVAGSIPAPAIEEPADFSGFFAVRGSSSMSSEPAISIDELLRAYSRGIFPMADGRHGKVQWYRANPRAVLPLERFKASRTLRRRVRRGEYEIRFDTAFERVIRACGQPRHGHPDTWINERIIQVFVEAHRLGLAHSVEAWTKPENRNEEPMLVGGLYGLALGGAFCGESMFSAATDASKVCLHHLVEHLKKQGFVLLDVQMNSQHMAQFGVIDIPREAYEAQLKEALKVDVRW